MVKLQRCLCYSLPKILSIVMGLKCWKTFDVRPFNLISRSFDSLTDGWTPQKVLYWCLGHHNTFFWKNKLEQKLLMQTFIFETK